MVPRRVGQQRGVKFPQGMVGPLGGGLEKDALAFGDMVAANRITQLESFVIEQVEAF